jgi:hypothetical protein
MVTVVYGSKGTGKTKRLLDMTNAALSEAKGAIIYITDTNNHMYEVKHQIRYVMTKNYEIPDLNSFIGFLSGMTADNHDIEYIFIDGAARIAGAAIEGLEPLFRFMERNEEIDFTLTVSRDMGDMPDFIKKHIK